jgi:hypothetical protein
MSDGITWPTPQDYGRRFAEIDRNLSRSFESAEFRWESPDASARVRYRLAKIALAGEDMRRAVAVLELVDSTDEQKAAALVELRQACAEAVDSFSDVDRELLHLLNTTSE